MFIRPFIRMNAFFKRGSNILLVNLNILSVGQHIHSIRVTTRRNLFTTVHDLIPRHTRTLRRHIRGAVLLFRFNQVIDITNVRVRKYRNSHVTLEHFSVNFSPAP